MDHTDNFNLSHSDKETVSDGGGHKSLCYIYCSTEYCVSMSTSVYVTFSIHIPYNTLRGFRNVIPAPSLMELVVESFPTLSKGV